MTPKILDLLYDTKTTFETNIQDMPLKTLKRLYETNIKTRFEAYIQDMPPEILKQQQRAILEVCNISSKMNTWNILFWHTFTD